MKAISLLVAGSLLAYAGENVLTPEDRREGFKLLFDGQTLRGWKNPARKLVSNPCWVIDDGALKTVVRAKFSEDLISEKIYADFDLKFEWKLPERGNTGVKYRIQREVFLDESKHGKVPFEAMLGAETSNPQSDRKTYKGEGRAQLYTVGFEFQLLDDERHPDGQKDPSHRTGALYSFIAAEKQASKPIGDWNSGRLIVKGDHFEHWINGTKVLEGSLKDPAVKAGAEKRWAPAPVIRNLLVEAKPRGPIALQHHGDEVWFRNIRIHALN
ncbi:MAG: DUF1080 domain-containing protein [Bryobacteraceae bacterium]|nr:DUF1080 domain-containing protein [Bryobacteraceae bacterium]